MTSCRILIVGLLVLSSCQRAESTAPASPALPELPEWATATNLTSIRDLPHTKVGARVRLRKNSGVLAADHQANRSNKRLALGPGQVGTITRIVQANNGNLMLEVHFDAQAWREAADVNAPDAPPAYHDLPSFHGLVLPYVELASTAPTREPEGPLLQVRVGAGPSDGVTTWSFDPGGPRSRSIQLHKAQWRVTVTPTKRTRTRYEVRLAPVSDESESALMLIVDPHREGLAGACATARGDNGMWLQVGSRGREHTADQACERLSAPN